MGRTEPAIWVRAREIGAPGCGHWKVVVAVGEECGFVEERIVPDAGDDLEVAGFGALPWALGNQVGAAMNAVTHADRGHLARAVHDRDPAVLQRLAGTPNYRSVRRGGTRSG